MGAVKHLLEGRPVRAPIHAGIVHFPLGFLVVATILNVVSWIARREALHLVDAAFWATIVGIASGLLAAIFGFVDFTSIRSDHRAKDVAVQHMLINVLAIVIFAVGAFLERHALDDDRAPLATLILSLLGFAGLMFSGYLGGHLVYSDGIGVGRHRRKTDMPERTHKESDTDGAFVSIGDADELPSGDILRACVNGITMAIANDRGRLFAVQEFCTHRFGPLSEGALHDGCIVCPWHQSTFQLKDGAVKSGPAKVPLKTYRVEIRGGKIWVEAPSHRPAHSEKK